MGITCCRVEYEIQEQPINAQTNEGSFSSDVYRAHNQRQITIASGGNNVARFNVPSE